ncbi:MULTISPECIES: homoserine kinase [unclassified Helicobacter]|uniref:homoserine kinase n=1 Tax=unclassified Helicobacter TaxID=2593540 RepID=UPI000CF0DB76|nr:MULTISPECIES: homoserine kinase [unclassified Helicobacter]
MKVKISVPATSANLGPGFDCLGLSLDFRNYFSVQESCKQTISIVGEGERFSKLRADNIFVKIFLENLKKFGIEQKKFAFEFKNQIPISRGLGSSSAVITAAIAMAYFFKHQRFNKQEILNLALHYERHPDNITPAVFGGFNSAVLENNKVVHLKQDISDEIRAVVVIPNRAISTKYSRQTLPKKYSNTDSVYNISRSSLMCMAFMQKRWDLLRVASKDKLHQYRRMKQYPVLFAIQKIALDNGALMSTLSGSGSSFLNICLKEDAVKIAQTLQSKFPNFKIINIAFDNQGLRLEKD